MPVMENVIFLKGLVMYLPDSLSPGLPGVTYHPLWSTNLIDWFPYGGLLPGSNGVMELLLPVDDQPMKFFRLRAEN